MMNKWIAPVLAPVMILTQVGCGAPTEGASSTGNPDVVSAKQGSVRDGESIFRGVFFGQGPVASLFPETWEGRRAAPTGPLVNEAMVSALSAQIDRMTSEGRPKAAIQRLTTLRAQLQDGSFDAAALRASADYDAVLADAKFEQLVSAMKSADPTVFASFGAEVQSGDHVRVQAAFLRAQKSLRDAAESTDLIGEGAGADMRCAVLFVAVFVMFYFWVEVASPQTTGRSLAQDEHIDRLTTRLALN
jgi:hypothetical protein